MSVKIMSAVFEAKINDLEYIKDGVKRKAKASTVKLVLLAIADHANDEGEAYPGFTKLEGKTALSRQGLIDTLDALKFNGILSVEDKPSRLKTNRYTIIMNALLSPPKVIPEPELELDLSSGLTSEQDDQSSHLTSTSQATLLELVKPLDHNHHLTIIKPMAPIEPARMELPIDWQIAANRETITLPAEDSEHKSKVDLSAFLFTQRGASHLEPMARAFMDARRIYAGKTDVSGWRKAFEAMRDKGVQPKHISAAVLKLTAAGMTVSSPFSISATAIDISNQLPAVMPPEIIRAAPEIYATAFPDRLVMLMESL